jgi:3-methyladenine DNA glycosylase AlkD
MKLQEVLNKLYALADEAIVAKKAKRWAVKTSESLGIHHKELKVLAKQIGTNNELALELIDTGIYEARLLASKILDPAFVTSEMMDAWVLFFDNWEICDSFSMAVFARTEYAIQKIDEWSDREEEYVKRAAFAIMAAYTMADKKADNQTFTKMFPYIREAADDNRTYVKKAVNWALRSIGKRNVDLKLEAIALSRELLDMNEKAASWIAKDAIKELEGENVRISNYPRSIYG